jgi:hypothetical protein
LVLASIGFLPKGTLIRAAVSRAKFNERGLSFEGKRESTRSARKAKAKGETRERRREESRASNEKERAE